MWVCDVKRPCREEAPSPLPPVAAPLLPSDPSSAGVGQSDKVICYVHNVKRRARFMTESGGSWVCTEKDPCIIKRIMVTCAAHGKVRNAENCEKDEVSGMWVCRAHEVCNDGIVCSLHGKVRNDYNMRQEGGKSGPWVCKDEARCQNSIPTRERCKDHGVLRSVLEMIRSDDKKLWRCREGMVCQSVQTGKW